MSTTMATISSIPAETLSEIFLYHVAVNTIDPLRRGWSYKWAQLRLVCHAWNEVLNYAMFWKNVPVTSPRAMELVLAHSVQTDLYMRGLVTSAVEQADRRKLALMLGSAGRIKELDLWVSEEVIRAFNAPTLEIKRLALKKVPGSNVAPGQDPSTLLIRFQSPALKTLTLENFIWKEIKPMFNDVIEDLTLDELRGIRLQEFITTMQGMKNLRRLDTNRDNWSALQYALPGGIEELSIRGQRRIDGDSFLEALDTLPNLVRLNLESGLTPPFDDPPTHTLAGLESISCMVGRSEDVKCLTFIAAPTLRHIQLQSSGMCHETDEDHRRTLRLVQPLLDQVVRNCPPRTAQFRSSPQYLCIAFTKEPTALVQPDEGIHLKLSMEFRHGMLNFMTTFFKDILERIENVYISDGDYCEKTNLKAWHKVFRVMHNVRSLHLERKGAKVMPEGLHHYEEDGICHTVFPKLEALFLDDVQFCPQRRKNQGARFSTAKTKKRSFIADLKRSFKLRDAAQNENNLTQEDRTLFQLVISNATRLYPSDVEALKKLGVEVVWDSITRRK
ncbi:hypothetical protein NEOLEDRAFT_1170843 [Neolentinus lepideus HHB14362 ss-1]|uniref:F-box domain-containing protein n=1 Tax=Neolentinus lepideus HHB14362 ss-1 TaxID=1314782 RepID=A0A165R5H9_9AGAM|nr:hypothetical protein NEOLEDRAFT_1170843 [Neolentinus lepideus HHB14362 ss-1]